VKISTPLNVLIFGPQMDKKERHENSHCRESQTKLTLYPFSFKLRETIERRVVIGVL
jgi:hypothetical protein